MVRTLRRLALVPLLAALVLAPGCQPLITVQRADVRGVSAGGVDVVITLLIGNPSGYNVLVRSVRAYVTLGGNQTLGPIDVSPNLPIGARQSAYTTVQVTVPWSVAPSLAGGSGPVPYRITGNAALSGAPTADYRIDQTGSLPRSAFARGGGLPLPF